MLEIESTATLKDKIESEYTFNGLNYELVNVPVYPAPVVLSATKVTSAQFTLAGANFSSVTNVTFSGGTVSSYVVNSTTSITVNFTTSAANGVKSFTVTTATGTNTLTNGAYVYSNIPYNYSTTAPIIKSVNVSELPKSKTGKTVIITGGNFVDVLEVIHSGGTTTGFVVDSSTQITLTVDTNTTSGYTYILVLTTGGTNTLANCIRMYTQVIPGTDVAWNNVTGANTETGAGYIRRNNTTISAAAGGNFLVTSSTSVDFEVEYYHDITNYALSLTWSAFTGLSQNATANAGNRFLSYNYYWQKANTYQYYQQQMTGSGGSLYYNVFNLRPTVTTRYVHQRIAGKQLIFAENMNNDAGVTISRVPLMTVTYYANTALYMDFTVEQRAGFKNILAKIYD